MNLFFINYKSYKLKKKTEQGVQIKRKIYCKYNINMSFQNLNWKSFQNDYTCY